MSYSLDEKRKILTQCVSEKTPIEIKYTTLAGKTSNKKFLPVFVRGNSAKGKDVGTTNDRVFNLTIEKIEILKLTIVNTYDTIIINNNFP